MARAWIRRIPRTEVGVPDRLDGVGDRNATTEAGAKAGGRWPVAGPDSGQKSGDFTGKSFSSAGTNSFRDFREFHSIIAGKWLMRKS